MGCVLCLPPLELLDEVVLLAAVVTVAVVSSPGRNGMEIKWIVACTSHRQPQRYTCTYTHTHIGPHTHYAYPSVVYSCKNVVV